MAKLTVPSNYKSVVNTNAKLPVGNTKLPKLPIRPAAPKLVIIAPGR